MQKHLAHNLIILDESGSMEGIKDVIIQGFNETIQNIKGIEQQFPDQEHRVTFLTFNSLGMRTHLLEENVNMLTPLDSKSYRPNATTPLYDAMGYCITRLQRQLAGKDSYNVLVTILTDGHENASREYSHSQIKSLIEELEKSNWTFTYMGTDHDVTEVADSLSIKHHMRFSKSMNSMSEAFVEERKNREAYYQKIRECKEVPKEYYDKSKWKNLK